MDLAREIVSRVPATEAFQFYGFDINRSGFTCCPFHGEKTGSLKVYNGGRGWYCYGCHQGGSVIDFVEKYFGLGFMDAVWKINDDFGLHLPIDEKASAADMAEISRMKAKKEAYDKAGRKVRKEYDDALTAYAKLDKASSDPQSPDFAKALIYKSSAEYRLSEASMALQDWENGRRALK